MDLKRDRQRAVFLAFAVYSLVAGAVWVVRTEAMAAGLLAGGLHLALAAILMVLAGPARGKSIARCEFLARLVPWVLWLLAWSEIGWLFAAAPPVYFDAAIARWDLAVFGTHWNDQLSVIWSGQWVREVMTGFYLSYYLLILGPPLVLIRQRRGVDFWRHTFGLLVTYLVCFAIYLIWPVRGPHEMALAGGTVNSGELTGLLPGVMNAIFQAGDSVGTAFPSSHCAGATAAALLCLRHFGRRFGAGCGVWAALIILSTIYTNNHYASDAAVGVGLALLVQTGEACREKNTGYRRHGIYRSAPRAPAHSVRAQAPGSGAGSP